MTRPVRLTLTERVQVFGLRDEIDWPAGTLVEVLGAKATGRVDGRPVTFGAYDVVGPDGKRATLPARLLRVASHGRAA